MSAPHPDRVVDLPSEEQRRALARLRRAALMFNGTSVTESELLTAARLYAAAWLPEAWRESGD